MQSRSIGGRKEIVGHVLRPRIVVYAGVLCAIVIAFVWGLSTRLPLRVDVIKDRTTLAREVEGGLIENVYVLQIMNMAEASRTLDVSVSGLEGVALDGVSALDVQAAQNKTVTVRVRVPVDNLKKGSHPVYFDIRAKDDPKGRRYMRKRYSSHPEIRQSTRCCAT